MDIKFLDHFKKRAVILSLLFLFGVTGCGDTVSFSEDSSKIAENSNAGSGMEKPEGKTQ